MLKQVFWDNLLSLSKWYKQLKDRQIYADNNECSGWPLAGITMKNI